jgi:hypothetical protein
MKTETLSGNKMRIPASNTAGWISVSAMTRGAAHTEKRCLNRRKRRRRNRGLTRYCRETVLAARSDGRKGIPSQALTAAKERHWVIHQILTGRLRIRGVNGFARNTLPGKVRPRRETAGSATRPGGCRYLVSPTRPLEHPRTDPEDPPRRGCRRAGSTV